MTSDTRAAAVSIPTPALLEHWQGHRRVTRRGIATGTWDTGSDLLHHSGRPAPVTRDALLALWDDTTRQIEELWPQIPAMRFEEVDTAFGAYEGVIYGLFPYWVDNEIHHRGQGYVYLRPLGIEPPAFYDRG